MGLISSPQSALTGTAYDTAFPASPVTGDRFWRTDLGLGAYYDGTRWVSQTLHTLDLSQNSATASISSTDNSVLRAANPWGGLYTIWAVEAIFAWSLNTTGTWTLNLSKLIGAVQTNLQTKAISYPSTTEWQIDRVAIGAVVESTATLFLAGATENTGSAICAVRTAMTYRLILT